MNIWPLIHFSGCFIYVCFIVLILYRNHRSLLNRICSVLFASLTVWTVPGIFFHNAYVSRNTARMALNIASIGWTTFGITFVWFALIFAKKVNEKFFILRYLTSLILALPFLYAQWSGKLIVNIVKYSYGWACVWTDSIWFYLYVGWLFFLTFLSCYILYSYGKRTAIKVEKKLASLILICSGISLILGSLTDIVFLKMGKYFMPNIANLTSMVWAAGLAYAMIKYDFLKLTPRAAARDIIETMVDSLILVSPEKKIILINPGTLDLLGYSREEMEGNASNIIFDKDKGDVPFEGEIYEELMSVGYVQSYSVVYKTKSGERIPVNFSASTVKNKNDVLVGIVFIARDMRDVVKLMEKEKELAVAAASAKTDRLKTEEIEKAYKKLKDTQNMLVQSEKLRELGEIGAGVVHELNNPLAGIIALMRVYKNKQKYGTKEYEDLEEMEKGCNFMAMIIRGLGDFTRESSGKFEKLNCNIIVDSILSFLAMQLESENIRIVREYDEGIPYVHGNRHQLQQIVISMINNSKDALSGKGFLAVRTRTIKTGDNVFVEIEFEDSGCGIEKNIIDKIFDPFFTTKMPGSGVGLGLSVAHSIIKAHKGSMSVESEEGKGAIFTIRLPAEDNIIREDEYNCRENQIGGVIS